MSDNHEQLEEYYYSLIDWAGTRIDYLHSRSLTVSAAKLKKYHSGNALALEEEFFEWFANDNSNKTSNVLFIPYYKDKGFFADDMESSSAT